MFLLKYASLTSCYNQVISDKQLIKHLQKEVARLEAARTPDPLSEKDYKIQQVHYQLYAYILSFLLGLNRN